MKQRPHFRWDWLVFSGVLGVIGFLLGSMISVPDRYLEQFQASKPARQAYRPASSLLPEAPQGQADLAWFFDLFNPDQDAFAAAAQRIADHWQDGFAPMLIELRHFRSDPRGAEAIMSLLERLTGQRFDGDLNRAFHWVWQRPYEPHPQYALFKSLLYAQIDPRFAAYFDDHTDQALIRLDEVRWGGVRRDGIPPLNRPAMVPGNSTDADYLADTDIVFGLEVHGDARAYPKRILAWHEMFKDVVGPADNAVSVNGVYCTLCGAMILYRTELNGVHHELGTSGFLYRSNKLMYDHATESMWSTLEGKPVIGPLVGQGIKLETLPVVTTTWAAWKKLHPDTTVLSLDTGHSRDYGEGVAYRDYFATDELMFTVPLRDNRLQNKAEVLALRFGDPQATPAALDTDALRQQIVFQGDHGGQPYVVFTDASGANRVYDATDLTFNAYDGQSLATDTHGQSWHLTEAALLHAGGSTRSRLSAHRAFWFGWYSAYPDTKLLP